jgi:hypothetical protein
MSPRANVPQLQVEAAGSTVPTVELLRKALVVARKLRVTEYERTPCP